MIFYLTYNDSPSGIFSSQVIDVVKFMNSSLNANVRLVSFISIRNFFNNKKLIKKQLPNSIVLPMFPGVHRWRYNFLVLLLLVVIYKPSVIIGRSVLATQLALKIKKIKLVKRVVYDGRGAIAAEWKEYGVVKHPDLLNQIFKLEQQVVLESDYRIAVSHKLVSYWNQEFEYALDNHVVIPCTLNSLFEQVQFDNAMDLRKELGFTDTDIVLVYSGSVAGWQSFDMLYQFVKPILISGNQFKLLFLSEEDANIKKLKTEFSNQVVCKKVSVSQVSNYLKLADYGLLIREESVTNKVASPVKFAEYLACGLQVIISNNLGDYSEFVVNNKCGFLLSEPISFKNLNDKYVIRNLALKAFTKNNFSQEYLNVLKKIKCTH